MKDRAAADLERFEAAVLPHMDAAYNLAHWLLHDEQDARDATQGACLRAWKFFATFHSGDARVWLLTIVRNACFSLLKKQRRHEPAAPFDEEIHSATADNEANENEIVARLQQSADAELLRQALAELPADFREALVLRELEEMSYKEIAAVAQVPLGTVMSRLARGRRMLQTVILRKGAQRP